MIDDKDGDVIDLEILFLLQQGCFMPPVVVLHCSICLWFKINPRNPC